MPNKFEKFAAEAKAMTDEKFRDKFSSLTKLTDSDIDKIINETGISNQDLATVLAEVKNATEINNQTVKSITNIQNGVHALVAITKKLLF